MAWEYRNYYAANHDIIDTHPIWMRPRCSKCNRVMRIIYVDKGLSSHWAEDILGGSAEITTRSFTQGYYCWRCHILKYRIRPKYRTPIMCEHFKPPTGEKQKPSKAVASWKE